MRIPDGIPSGQKIRAVFIHSTQFDGSNLYEYNKTGNGSSTAKTWDKLAADLGCANMKMNLGYWNRDDSQETTAKVNEIKSNLKKFAEMSGRPEIEFAPVTMDGLSGAGSAVVWLGLKMKERVLCIFPHHGRIYYTSQNLTELPTCFVAASRDEDSRNSDLARQFQTIRGKSANLFSVVVQPQSPHAQMSHTDHEQDFQTAFIRHFIDQRVPKEIPGNKLPTLMVPKASDGWVGVYDSYTNSGTRPGIYQNWYLSNPKIVKASQHSGGTAKTVWLPNEQIARIWLTYHTTGRVGSEPVALKPVSASRTASGNVAAKPYSIAVFSGIALPMSLNTSAARYDVLGRNIHARPQSAVSGIMLRR